MSRLVRPGIAQGQGLGQSQALGTGERSPTKETHCFTESRIITDGYGWDERHVNGRGEGFRGSAKCHVRIPTTRGTKQDPRQRQTGVLIPMCYVQWMGYSNNPSAAAFPPRPAISSPATCLAYLASCVACWAIASAFASPRFLFSPCLPFYNVCQSCYRNAGVRGASRPATLQISNPSRLVVQLEVWVLPSGIFGPLLRQWPGIDCNCKVQHSNLLNERQ